MSDADIWWKDIVRSVTQSLLAPCWLSGLTFEREQEVDFKGPYLCSRSFVKALGGNPGVILNVSSNLSHATADRSSAYAMSKTAINRSALPILVLSDDLSAANSYC